MPSPRHRRDVQRAAELAHFARHHVQADAAPRKATDVLRGGEPGFQDQYIEIIVAKDRIGLDQATLDRAGTDGVPIQSAAVVADLQHHFRPFAADRDANAAFGRLARRVARFGGFQAMGHCIAEHVLQRCRHALQHIAVEFALRTIKLELRALAGFAGGLADDPAQARHQGIERHHARAHEAFLQFRTYPRLLQQQCFVLASRIFHRAMQAHQVGRGLGECARQLLQGAETVELKRIEAAVAGVLLALEAGDDLRFGFCIQATQLVAQADVGLLHFRSGTAECPELLFQARTINRHFAGVVHQAVKQVGADSHLFLRCTHADIVVIDEPVSFHRRRQGFEVEFLHDRGESDPVIHGFNRGYRCFGTVVEFVDKADGHAHRAARGDASDHSMQAIETTLQQWHAIGAEFRTLGNHGFEQGLHGMAEFANRHHARHACATLHGMQVALQADHHSVVFRGLAQLREQSVGMIQQVAAFLHEDVNQLRIHPAHVECFVGIVGRGRTGQ